MLYASLKYTFSRTYSINKGNYIRPRGKESTKVRKTQNKGKESENSYKKNEEITVGLKIFQRSWPSFSIRRE